MFSSIIADRVDEKLRTETAQVDTSTALIEPIIKKWLAESKPIMDVLKRHGVPFRSLSASIYGETKHGVIVGEETRYGINHLLVLTGEGDRVFRVNVTTDRLDPADSIAISAFIRTHGMDHMVAGFDFLREVEIRVVEPLADRAAKLRAFLRDNEKRNLYS